MSYYNKSTLISRPGYGARARPLSGVTDDIGDFLKTGFKGALDFYGQQQKTEGEKAAYQRMLEQQQAQQAGGTPGWVWPVAIGGAVLAGVLLLRKRK